MGIQLKNTTTTVIKRVLAIGLFLMSIYINAQVEATEINESPYHVIKGHAYYLELDNYKPSIAAKAIPKSFKNPEELAIKLKKVLDGLGVNSSRLNAPKQNNYLDTISSAHVYYLYGMEKSIYVEKIKGKWYYSKETIEKLPELYDSIYILDINFKEYFHQDFWYKKFFSIRVIQWFGLLVLLLVSFLVYYLARSIYFSILSKYLRKKYDLMPNVKEQLKRSSLIFGALMGATFFNSLLPQIQLPVTWNALLLRSVGIGSIFLMVALINKIIDVIVAYLEERTHGSRDNQVIPVIRKLLKFVVWILGLVYVLQYLNIDVFTILTGLSIGGLALALAAQDTVKNLIGSVMIILDNPFRVDDWIEFDGVEGVVEEIGVRSTRIRTFEDSVVSVPNSILADNKVNNIGLRKYRRFKTKINLKNKISIDKISEFIDKIKTIIEEHPAVVDNRYEVGMEDMNNGQPTIMFYCFFDVSSYDLELRSRQEILTEIMVFAEEKGIEFGVPTSEINLNTKNAH
ncbi:mechanosensitive ion channel family protein [Tenacibaculum tangerinum]|uniref:Mechanosensitive ion channel family protein n=1 Tax=Tenacibaculum tangerinum TaxID=3038772 RepID=A0ABY8L531_9FLAO|nr:mechanosensitive ion channel family protein [Tenacibaculum tangerinum]WGH75134.1 mechanosensitive ion channel family protein [Tenacibaculum tangerinum]